ncbi:hypothetical protein SLE2022_275710 [Rubroshorea leprosula]
MDRAIDEDIIEWILEFIIRSTSEEALQKKLVWALSDSNSRVCSRVSKTIALRSIEYEIEDASVSERILENLEIIDELDRSQGLSIMDSMKKAYCAVAVECTVKYLASSSNRNGKYFEAVKRIWRGRIGNLEKLNISKLLTEELIASGEEIEAAVWDDDLCSRLMDRNTRNAALFSVRDYLEEALPSMGPTILEMGSKLMRSVGGDHLHPTVSIREGSGCSGDERDQEGKEKEKTPSAEVRQELERLKGTSLELQKAVTDPLPEALRDDETIALEMVRKNASGEVVGVEEGDIEPDGAKEVGTRMESSAWKNASGEVFDVEEGNIEPDGAKEAGTRMESPARKNAGGEAVDVEEGDIGSGGAKEVGIQMQSSSHPNMSKRSLMERNSTAQVYKWDDSIDDDDSSEERAKRLQLSNPKNTDVSPPNKRKTPNFARNNRRAERGSNAVASPLKKQESPKFARKRKARRWSLQEEEALRDGVEKYGIGSWKMILKSNPEAFQERTEVDLKDKWRNLSGRKHR